MNWKKCFNEEFCPNWRYYPGICLKGMNKTMKPQDSKSLDRDLVIGHPEYEATVLTTWLFSILRCTGNCEHFVGYIHWQKYLIKFYRYLYTLNLVKLLYQNSIIIYYKLISVTINHDVRISLDIVHCLKSSYYFYNISETGCVCTYR
jgi:hypothetical protein